MTWRDLGMKKTVLLFILILSLAVNAQSFAHAEGQSSVEHPLLNEKVIALKYDMQKLWIEHAWWTRSRIVSKIANLEDQENVLKRLLHNQEDLGNLIKPYYREEAGNKLTELLKEHIIIAGQIIDAAKKRDQASVDRFNRDWHRNADEIVAFLANANPNWSKKDLTDMFYTHLKFTTDEVVDRLEKDWMGDIKTADLNETHLIHMGDFLTDGIVKQFPEKFE